MTPGPGPLSLHHTASSFPVHSMFPCFTILTFPLWVSFSFFLFFFLYSFLSFFLPSFLPFFLEREREGENIDVREKHWLVASHTCPCQGPNLQSRHVSWPGIKPVTFHFVGWCPTNWATPIRAIFLIFFCQDRIFLISTLCLFFSTHSLWDLWEGF